MPLILATLNRVHVQTHHQLHLDNINSNAQLQTLPQHMAILQGITQSMTIITQINRWNTN